MLRLRASNSYINMILSTWLKKLKCCVRHWIQIQGLSKIVPQAVLTFQEEIATKKTSQLCETDITTLVSHGDSHKVRHGVSHWVGPLVSLAIGLTEQVYVRAAKSSITFIETFNDSP